MDDLLRAAQSELQIEDVYIAEESAKLAEEGPWNFRVQDGRVSTMMYMSRPDSFRTLESEDEAGDRSLMYEFKHLMGIRVVLINKGEHDSEDSAYEEVATVEAMYSVIYQSKNGKTLEADAVEAFAMHNVQHNLWPFWREHAFTTLGKMGVRVPTLPLLVPLRAPNKKKTSKKTTK